MEKDQWANVQIMLNPVDSKQAWLGVPVQLGGFNGRKVLTKQELLARSQSESEPIFVLGFASSWTQSDKPNEKGEKNPAKRAKIESDPAKDAAAAPAPTESNAFLRVPWDFMEGFQLFFFGTVGIEGAGNAVPLTSTREAANAPSLPWQIFGKGWDNLQSSEMPCLAFVVPGIRRAKSGKGDKIKATMFMKAAADGDAAENSKASSTSHKDIADQAVLGKSASTKRKPKRKAAAKEKKSDKTLSDTIKFVEAPLRLASASSIFCFCSFFSNNVVVIFNFPALILYFWLLC